MTNIQSPASYPVIFDRIMIWRIRRADNRTFESQQYFKQFILKNPDISDSFLSVRNVAVHTPQSVTDLMVY